MSIFGVVQFSWIFHLVLPLKIDFPFPSRYERYTSDLDLPDLAFPYSEDSCNEGDFSCKEEIGDAGGFPNPKLYAGACLDLDDHPSFEEDEAGSSRWPPRG